jgi:sugar/nucleoside kinase (ribokinase family)
VVGAAHIDVWADRWSTNADKIDKIGNVKFAVGGTAYNIAVDLAQAGIPTSWLSVVRKGMFSAVWIRTRLKEAGVNLDFLQTSDRVPESGFVAIRQD